ncbi:hypothetical protein Hanom_Chr17g01543471 [Helianthus anomalus]
MPTFLVFRYRYRFDTERVPCSSLDNYDYKIVQIVKHIEYKQVRLANQMY